jgi:phytoene dehydrogenase-like protein
LIPTSIVDLNIGFESLADFKDEFDRIRSGLLPASPRLNVAVNSLYDPTDAPEGKATGLIRVFAPFALADGGAEAWRAVARDFGGRCLERWAGVCTNMDDGLVRKWVTETPYDISQKMINYRFGDWMVGRIHPKSLLEHRPTDELSEYRTPIKGLYMCGASQHPHGYITFAPGYNCLGIIADDFHIEKWWQQTGSPDGRGHSPVVVVGVQPAGYDMLRQFIEQTAEHRGKWRRARFQAAPCLPGGR